MNTIHFTKHDRQQIEQRGSDSATIAALFEFFTKGFQQTQLIEPATIDNGILQWDKETVEELTADYEQLIKNKKVVKFVPASGAASRMFKDLFALLQASATENADKGADFLKKLPHMPFYEALQKKIAENGLSLENEIAANHYPLIISYLLQEQGLNYGALPKGAILFHRYENESRTALEEHLVEAAFYAQNSNKMCRIHFTVASQHKELLYQLAQETLPQYENRFQVKYDLSYSLQDPKTDTLAATENNEPFRDNDGNLLFRPGGHGALIYNLNDLEADIVFIKNIDNVIYEDKLSDTITYKQALAAWLLHLQHRIFNFLQLLEEEEPDPMTLMEIADFMETDLMMRLSHDSIEASQLHCLLNRPIRVCGMVKNEKEPGGGPFWVRNSNGESSLQIVETSQIDIENPEQFKLLQAATHFNPVDMVCGLKNYRGEKFDLLQYIDPQSGFISIKSHEGRTLKAMELPGLWNGAMAQWITLFVETPSSTFHPVKTVFDL